MKKIGFILASIMITTTMMFGCGNKEEKPAEKTEVKVIVPDGIPAVSIAKMIKENIQVNENTNITYEVQKTTDNLVTEVMKGGADVAIVPSNLAAQSYNKELGYKLVGTVGWGSTFLVSTDGTASLDNLKGKEIYNTGKGLTPDIVFRSILKKKGIAEGEINLSYVNAASELAPSIIGGKITNSVVPEPALSTIMMKKGDGINVLLDINEEWKSIYGSEYGYPQSSLIVKEELIEKNKEFVKDFTKAIDESISFVYDSPENAGVYCQEVGINTSKEVLSKAIERINLKYISSEDCKDEYITYFSELNKFEPKTIGGKVPDENIFYKE